MAITNPDLDGFALISSFRRFANLGYSFPELCSGGIIYLESFHDFSRRFQRNGKMTIIRTPTKEAFKGRLRNVGATCNGERNRDSANSANIHRPTQFINHGEH
ncbi:hypothetical protein [Rhizobium aethiopicum]|uniref:hypothetical protein n=1 Tax=Rhizobium aethiopicum TaxID=1138170 RepID=UPI001428C7C1|nr:hypothetical protein [Rhizobium aethiopicum]